ncbi:NETR-like protein [Mya arenaria]|uniref:NETR-like protein n=1 Tax=Mya arenaria TaxID=6604 RepID=A0ABY7EIP0_MYAAR|nr:NETR-like protein [Mya arenaria]
MKMFGATLNIFVLSIFISYVLSDVNVESNKHDRSINEIKENVTHELDNKITTENPNVVYKETANTRSTENPSLVKNQDTTEHQRSEMYGSTPPPIKTLNGHSHAMDPIDKYLVGGILDIVDGKFETLNKRVMTLERGINNMQYYNVRSFRVVNTHLHAVDTILHSLHTQVNQVEQHSQLFEQSIGSVKHEVTDLHTNNYAMLQAIEQNLAFYHADLQSRLSEVHREIENTNQRIDDMKNETSEFSKEVDGLRLNQESIQMGMASANALSKELIKSSHLTLNETQMIKERSKDIEIQGYSMNKIIEIIARNVSMISKDSDEMRNAMSLILANISTNEIHMRARRPHVGEPESVLDGDYANETFQELRVTKEQTHISCAKVFELLDEKLKHMNVTVSSTKDNSPREDCSSSKDFPADFKNQSRKLMRALATVNENVYQSVTLYRHTGNLIERVISDTDIVAQEQMKLREDLVNFLLNGTFELFNRSLPEFSDLNSRTQTTQNTNEHTDENKCVLSEHILQEMSYLSKNSSQLIELMTDIASSSSGALKDSLNKLNKEIELLSKQSPSFENFKLPEHAEAFSKDEPKTGNNILRDIQNKTDLIYLFAEAIASNTGWIPFVYHRVKYVENQVNKSLNIITGMDTKTEEILLRQKANMAFMFKPIKKHLDELADDLNFDSKSQQADKISSSTPSTMETEPIVSTTPVTQNTAEFEAGFGESSQEEQGENVLSSALNGMLTEPYITLIDGGTDRGGRVEIYHKGEWGTIATPINHVEASYICRKLGYLGGVATVGGHFGSGSGAFWQLNVTCLRTRWCNAVSHVTDPSAYNHNDDAGVICDHMLRLTKINEDDESEIARQSGKLEIYHQNSWVPVCHDSWSQEETIVVCKQLGFVEGASRPVQDNSITTSDWMMNVTCSGHEYRLDACSYSGFVYNGCSSSKYVYIVCS